MFNGLNVPGTGPQGCHVKFPFRFPKDFCGTFIPPLVGSGVESCRVAPLKGSKVDACIAIDPTVDGSEILLTS